MHGLGHGADVVVRQDHAGSRLHMRGKHQRGLFGADGGHHLVHGARLPRCLVTFTRPACLEHDGLGGNGTHVENLRPAVAEPAVADDQHFFAVRELARHSLHTERAAARHQHGRFGVVDLFQDGRNVGHHAPESGGHVVERAVGVDH